MKKRKYLLALLLAGAVALLATGCDKLKKDPETEAQTEAPTEKPTEPPTEKPTEPPTEKQTEPPTEKQTEPPTETEPVPKTPEEEVEQQSEFDQLRMLYAKDDINVRSAPDTSTDENIIYAFWQGDQLTAVGETPGWYVVELEDYDDQGYVSKQFVSEEKVEPKTDEEREAAIQAALGSSSSGSGENGGDGQGSTGSSAGTDTAAVDAEYGVSAYAESFSIQASTGANVRVTPSQDGSIIDTIASGTIVTALGETDRWYKVEYDGTVGYVNKNLFQ